MVGKIPGQRLNVLHQVSRAIRHLFRRLDEMPLGNGVAGFAGGHLAGVAQNAGVFGDHRGSGQHLLLVGGWVEQVLAGSGDGLEERRKGREGGGRKREKRRKGERGKEGGRKDT